ncbi:unnamed protein product [Phaedon cochleariae]|uniref:Acyltransferase 3 domain-containing protein n=1 Tax=Phaedon cochleariae TaxID=80249 RepID=A0A9N9X638_PHACE|nr:unnamed protein product [Phaedon cochleariae]
MKMTVKLRSVVLVLVIYIFRECYGEYREISDVEYASMPDLFFLDNYEKCLALGKQAVFCTLNFELQPLVENETNNLWNIIKNVSSDPRNYRHDHLRHGICVSTFCPNFDEDFEEFSVKDVVEECYNNKYKSLGLKGNISNLKCDSVQSKYPFDIYDIIFITCFLFYSIFVIFASIYEGIARYQEKEVYDEITGTIAGQLITAFSIPKNWNRLKSINSNQDAEKLRSIQGMRFYNMICVILCHTVMITFAVPVANPKYTENMTNEPLNMFLANGNYAVQTFFVISGWLLSYHFFQMLEGRKHLSLRFLLVAFMNRYIRLTPTLAIMIAFEATLLIHLGKGPYWDILVGREYRNCRQNWWTNLLYINNYVEKNNMCLHQTWYIASDTQLYLLSLLLLMIIWKNQDKINIILGSILTIGLIIPGAISFMNNYDIVIHQYPEVLYDLRGLQIDAWHHLYTSGYSNITGYAIGLTFGYIFYKYKNKVLQLSKMHVILWWILTFGMCNFIVLIAARMYDPAFRSSRLESALYWAFGKNVFALGIAIAIFGFSQKIGWFARSVTEWKAVSVLGRLTYSTYIVHTAVIRIRGGLMRSPTYVNDYLLLMTTLGDIVLSYLVGTVMCLMFEMPISALQKLMVPQMKRPTPERGSSEKSLKTLDYDACDNEENECSKV